MMVIQKRDYKLNGLLEDGSDAVDELANEFENGNTAYVCDMISEIAHSYTPIYYNEIWENARYISDYIEQAISDGFVDTSNLDLMKTLQTGYYVYYTEVLYENYDVIAFNKVSNDVNIYLSEQNKSVDEDLLEAKIDTELALFDSNSRINDIDEITKVIIELIEDGDFDE